MPLDFLVEGLGFNASVTKINQEAEDEASIITGISDWTYNWTGYYETELFQARVTYITRMERSLRASRATTGQVVSPRGAFVRTTGHRSTFRQALACRGWTITG